MSDDSLRIVLVDLPRLLADLFERAAAERPGVRLVRAPEGRAGAAAADAADADVAIVGLPAATWPEEFEAMIQRRARPWLLGVGCEDGQAHVYALSPRREDLGQRAPEEVLAYVLSSKWGSRTR